MSESVYKFVFKLRERIMRARSLKYKVTGFAIVCGRPESTSRYPNIFYCVEVIIRELKKSLFQGIVLAF